MFRIITLLILFTCTSELCAQSLPCSFDNFRGAVPTPGDAVDVVVHDGIAYIADSGAGLHIINARNVDNPYSISSTQLAGSANAVVFHDNYVYLATGDSGLHILDTTDLSAPVIVSRVETPGDAVDLCLQQNLVALANGSAGCTLIDVTDPTNPTILSAISLTGNTIEIEIQGQYLYSLESNAGMTIFDISDPQHPVFMDSYTTTNTTGFDVHRERAYLFTETRYHELDVSDPSNIRRVIETGLFLTNDAYVFDSYAVLLTDLCVQELRYTENLADYEYSHGFCPRNEVPRAVHYEYPFAYSVFNDQFRIFRLNRDEIVTGHAATNSSAEGASVSGSLAAVADGIQGLLLFDITNPADPMQLGSLEPDDFAAHVEMSGEIVFMTDDREGVMIIDISNPMNPVLLHRYQTPTRARSIALSGSIAFITDNLTGLHIIDWSDPTNPEVLSTIDTPGWALDIKVRGDYAYVACRGSGLQIIDISDTSNPAIVAEYDTPGLANRVALLGPYALIADGVDGLQIISIADPMNPNYVSTYVGTHEDGATISVDAVNTTAYIGYDSGRIFVVDLTDPLLQIPPYGTINTPGSIPNKIATDGDQALVCLGTSGIKTLNIATACEDNCPADLNADGQLNFFDVSAMLVAYQSNHPAADFNGDGSIDFFDVSEFIARYQEGCTFSM